MIASEQSDASINTAKVRMGEVKRLRAKLAGIQESDSANTGEIVVALVDNEEATLKRLRRRGDSIALEAANPAYETRLYGSDRVKVQGKLVGLIRRY